MRGLLVLLLAGLVVVGSATATPWRVSVPDVVLPDAATDLPVREEAPLPSSGAVPEQGTPETLTVVAIVLAVAGALLIVLLVVLLARRYLASLAAPAEEDGDDPPAPGGVAPGAAPAIALTDLQDAVQQALRRVDGAATPHDAVVAAWVSLEDAAATRGTARDPAETPTEFATRLLADTPAPAARVRELRALYAEARFTRRPVGPGQVARARDALRDVARALDDAHRSRVPGAP
ncbi:hypothetical protein GCM10009809_33750 [Isoptericola hypogeus]|uniref:Protein-glutamine gamma-glutamyltransferase-like C-terminal domain-containing protein n=1 Tax=Isoptericola hypogeus TaxID=300179 RepID=A0ABP4VV37_9MICO